MFMNVLTAGKKSYEARIRLRIRVSIVMLVLGIITIGALGLRGFVVTTSASDFSNGYYLGMGAGLIGASIVLLIKNLRLKNNKEKMEEAQLEEDDERMVFIRLKAFYVGSLIFMACLYIMIIFAGLINTTILLTLLVVFIVFFAILVGTTLVLKKRY